MKKKDIVRYVEEIRDIADDDEVAHGKEDSLREMFIASIAKRKDSLGEKAKLVLSTNKIEFARWCA